MAGPWERYQHKPTDGPWKRYSASSAADFGNVLGAVDTVPGAAAPAVEAPDFLQVLGDAIQRGSASSLASTLHAGSDFIDQSVQGPIRTLAGVLGLGETFSDPLGAAAVSDQSLGVEREINADRAAAAQTIGGREGIVEALNPYANEARAKAAVEFGEPGNYNHLTLGDRVDAVKQYGLHLTNIGGESLPLLMAAIATRNPELGAAALGTVTGAQEYTDLRTQGVDRLPAAATGIGTGAIETAGESLGLPFVMGKGSGVGSLVRAMLAEGGQEAPVQLAQQALEDQATRDETPILQQLGDALDALLVGAGMGGAGHGLSVATDKVTGQRGNTDPGVDTRPLDDTPQTNAISPELLAAGNAALGDAIAPELHPAAGRAPLGSQPGMLAPLGESEPTDDLDVLLRNLPPDVVDAALSVLDPNSAPDVATPTPPLERASLPAQDLARQAAARMRVTAQERAARTAAPAAQSPAAPVGSRPAGGDFTEAPTAPAALPATDKAPRQPVRPRKPMDLLRVLAANGGLNREAFRAQGVDPAEFTRRAGFQYLFRKEGGMTLDQLREFMQQEGYLQRDPEHGKPVVDDNDALDLFDRALRSGEEVFSLDQADAVAAQRFERFAQDEQDWEAEFGAQHPDVAPEDYATAATVADIAERARAVGVDEFDIAPFSDEADTDYIARLEREIDQQEARRGTETGADQADRGERVRGQAPRPVVAETPGLFAEPTAREEVAAEGRRRDGRTGADVPGIAGTDLGAGRAREQASLPETGADPFGRRKLPGPVEIDTGKNKYRVRLNYHWRIAPNDFNRNSHADATWEVEKLETVRDGGMSVDLWRPVPGQRVPVTIARQAEAITQKFNSGEQEPSALFNAESRNPSPSRTSSHDKSSEQAPELSREAVNDAIGETTPSVVDFTGATGRSVITSGRLLSFIDAAKAAGTDLSALRSALANADARARATAVADALDAIVPSLQPKPKLRVTGTKNAVTDAERDAAGRNPILRDAIQTNEETLVRAMRELHDDPSAGQIVAEKLARGGVEGISLAEEAILLVHKTSLLNDREAAAKTLADPNASEEAKEVARQTWAEKEAQIAMLDQAAVNSGREWGRLGQFRQRMLREDFTFAAMERKERARLERPLTQDESATVRAMADTIAGLQEKVNTLQTRLANAASENAYEALTKRLAHPRRTRTLDNLRRAANDARARLAATPEVSRNRQSGAIISPTVFADYAVIGAYHIANGAAKLADWLSAMRADLGESFDRFKAEHLNIFKAAKKELDKPLKADASVAEVMERIDPDNITPKDVRKLVEALVGEGMRGEPEVIGAAANHLSLAEDEVRALFVQTEPRGEPTMTEAQEELRDLRKIVRLQNEIDRLEAGEPKPARGAPAEDSQAVAAKKAELAELRKRIGPQRMEDGRYQDMRGKQIEKRIAELQQRIADGDFAARPRIPHALSEANQRAQFELEKAKHDFLRHQFEDNLRKRTPLSKVFGVVPDTFNLARAIMTSLDLSAILRQGGFIGFGHPVRALRSVVPSLRAFASERAEHRVTADIESRQNAPLYKRYKLQLTGIGAGPLTQIEEVYASRWLAKFPTLLGGGLVRGSGRSYTAFLNKLRADSFDAMAASLGRRQTLTEAEGKAIANYINMATGRGKVGRNENAAQGLNTVFFAPRLVASRFQLLAGQPLYGGTPHTRKMIVQEYARFLLGVGVTLGLLAFSLAGDEDDPEKMIGLDPRSSDFLKVRVGNTYIDPLAGLSQVTTFLARLATGETVTGKGEVKPLRPHYTLTDLRRALGADIPAHKLDKDGGLAFGAGSSADVIGRFLRSKLAPVPGAIVNALSGSNVVGQDMTPAMVAQELITPMSFQNITDIMEEQGAEKGTAITIVGLLGMGIQYRAETNAQQFADFNAGITAVQADVKDRLAALPVDQWPQALGAMKQQYGPAMNGVELQYYKQDGKYGDAGEPRRDADGKPILKSNRISDESAYRKNAQAEDGEQTHHIIPDNLARHHPLMEQARSFGYDLDRASNLINLPARTTSGQIAHNTSHPEYDAEVFGALQAAEKRLKKDYGSLKSAPAPAVLDAVRKIEADMRSKIERQEVPTKDGRLAVLDMEDEAVG